MRLILELSLNVRNMKTESTHIIAGKVLRPTDSVIRVMWLLIRKGLEGNLGNIQGAHPWSLAIFDCGVELVLVLDGVEILHVRELFPCPH